QSLDQLRRRCGSGFRLPVGGAARSRVGCGPGQRESENRQGESGAGQGVLQIPERVGIGGPGALPGVYHLGSAGWRNRLRGSRRIGGWGDLPVGVTRASGGSGAAGAMGEADVTSATVGRVAVEVRIPSPPIAMGGLFKLTRS